MLIAITGKMLASSCCSRKNVCYSHRTGGNRKRGSKLLETVFSIAICRQLGDNWQSKNLLLTIFDLRSSIVLAFSIAAYPITVLQCTPNWMAAQLPSLLV